jgi:hypothetical protein
VLCQFLDHFRLSGKHAKSQCSLAFTIVHLYVGPMRQQ